jgi:alkylation response protein AidB-like acyl-CoA dehydrogenase
MSITSVGSTIMTFGSDEQKAEWLPKIQAGEMTFALGYTEPNAGTDLASLQTRAVRDGDEWVINGQKIYTSSAHVSTHVWLAARTNPDAPKHRGISTFVVDIKTPGITVRPLWTMGGSRTNETFWEDVRIPADSLVGELDRGWYQASNALDLERVVLGASTSRLRRSLEQFVDHLKTERPELIDDSYVRTTVAEAKVDVEMARALSLTCAALVDTGMTPTMEGSMSKVWSSETAERMYSQFMEILGPAGVLDREEAEAPLEGALERGWLGSPVSRFGGGTNDIQRRIIATRGLGLPRG